MARGGAFSNPSEAWRLLGITTHHVRILVIRRRPVDELDSAICVTPRRVGGTGGGLCDALEATHLSECRYLLRWRWRGHRCNQRGS